MLNKKIVENLVKVVRKAYSDYPKNDSTVDTMIEQGIRSAYIRGVQASDRDVEAFTLEDRIESLAADRRHVSIRWTNIVNQAADGDPMAKALVAAVQVYSLERYGS
jgi:hypothetical protein